MFNFSYITIQNFIMINIEDYYLNDIPAIVEKHGFCKVLAVRKEIIHLKHIMTEIFVRKTIDINKMLHKINMNMFDYMEYITNRTRKIHHFPRLYKKDCNIIVKDDKRDFFISANISEGLDICIVLDFDGVVTKKNFEKLYRVCVDKYRVQICSANPNITNDWFEKRNLPIPYKINSMKGKEKKIKMLKEIQKKYDKIFFVDNEIEYLEYAWIFGIQTYYWTEGKIKYFSMKTK